MELLFQRLKIIMEESGVRGKALEKNGFVNCFSEVPSLTQIAAAPIAIKMWTQSGVKDIISTYIDKTTYLSSQQLEREVLDRLRLDSFIPSIIKYEIFPAIQTVKSELSKLFYKYGYRELGQYYKSGGTIYWTAEGIIDMVKSLKPMLREENSETMCSFYKVACFYCLEDDISDLWAKIPPENKSLFRIAAIDDRYEDHLVLYWTSVLEDKLDSFIHKLLRVDFRRMYNFEDSIKVNMIACAIHIGNITALKYFWRKLTEQERNRYLGNWLSKAGQELNVHNRFVYQKRFNELDIVCFLLSQARYKIILIDFFKEKFFVMMFLSQNSRFQRFFWPAILQVMKNLQTDEYLLIMEDIGVKMRNREMRTKFFKEVWSVTPLYLKRSFLLQDSCAKLVLHFLWVKELNMTLRLLKVASKHAQKKIISYMFGWSKFQEFLFCTDLSLLREFLLEVDLPSECNLQSFKPKRFFCPPKFSYEREERWHICHEWIYESNFHAVEAFLKWAFETQDKIKRFKEEKLEPTRMCLFLLGTKSDALDQFTNWCFETEGNAREFKQNYFREEKKSNLDSLFKEVCRDPNNAIEKFIKLQNFFSEEVIELKTVCPKYVEIALSKECYELVNVILEFCLNSMDEIKQFKNEFILSAGGVKKYLFRNFSSTSPPIWYYIECLLVWSSPLTNETAKEVRKLILLHNFEFRPKLNMDTVIDLLDSLVGEDTEYMEA